MAEKVVRKKKVSAAKEPIAEKLVSKKESVKSDKYPTKCRAQSLVDVMSKFTVKQKKAIKEIGFGGLLKMNISVVPSGLTDLLVEAFDCDSLKVHVTETEEFVLSQYDVHDLFLLPVKGNNVVLTATGRGSHAEDTELKNKWRRKFNISTAQNIKLDLVTSWFKNNKGACGDEFKQMFVLYALSTFLAPTPNYSVDFRLLKAVDDVEKIKGFNWSKYVYEKVVEGVKGLKTGTVKCLCGCIVVLLLAYIHRFEFHGEVQPTDLPRY
ncbi:uncharacterized protein LOC141632107 [Silene latifolia]|uniref:uncharacterized protein LOC141632107 n=1 Tax=Silene latifolia TaxID=37657 RepID=UPI003D76F885